MRRSASTGRSGSRSRRVVQVVVERPGELIPRCFWLLASTPSGEMSGEDLLALYRKRGKAEGHLGELMSVVAPALSSTSRRKSHYRGKEIRKREKGVDAFACNQVRLLLAGLRLPDHDDHRRRAGALAHARPRTRDPARGPPPDSAGAARRRTLPRPRRPHGAEVSPSAGNRPSAPGELRVPHPDRGPHRPQTTFGRPSAFPEPHQPPRLPLTRRAGNTVTGREASGT